ncbi:MAG: Homoserine dehydrogenase [Alphaproteobacteria bacterium MarineAlpha4_Bin2]|nr:MAG: Homoserine dehydrogenase [Alphaproteobacteria bacterium MarineAlpha4_Bin2]
MSTPLKVAIAGLGTVGVGTIELLSAQSELLTVRCGRSIEVVAVSAQDRAKNRGVDLSGITWFDDPVAMARDADTDVFVELIGGSEGIAKEACEAAINAGRHVVTANKALIALYGTELALSAEQYGVALAYEAAVAGGIPIIKSLREGLAGNRIESLHGILNGTCNYILTTMRETGRAFAGVLSDAQELGYAEADPSFDIDGVDAAHKLAILTSVAFGTEVDFGGIHVEGIRHIAAEDIEYAGEFGYRIKLLGISERTEYGIQQRVHPAMVPEGAPIAGVEGVFNAVVTEGDFVGTSVLEGRGAGAGPTASAVVGDIADLACQRIIKTFGIPASDLSRSLPADFDHHVGAYYIRLMVDDQPGVFAEIAAELATHEISIEGVIQRSRSETEAVPVVMTTHDTTEAAIQDVLAAFAKLNAVREPPRMIRIEKF